MEFQSVSLEGCRVQNNNTGLQLPQEFTFHHIGYACASIAKARVLFESLGYCQEGVSFRDEAQGVLGCFLVGNGPRIELLENMQGRDTLTPWLEAGTSMYHVAYTVCDLEECAAWARSHRGKLIVPPISAVAFDGAKICFFIFPGRFMIEFIQRQVDNTQPRGGQVI